VLAGTGGAVEGMVVDSAGKPMADVRVFNTGDAPETVSARTDASGRFRLEGLRSGPAYVFAEKPECRFTGLRTAAGATGVVVKLLRSDEPLPPSARRPQQPSYEEQQKVARRMLQKLWATDLARTDYAGSLISYMARIDRQRAQKWSAEAGPRYDAIFRRTTIEQVADRDLDEALSLIAQDGSRAAYTLSALAGRYMTTDPAKAMRCAEEFAVRARAMDQPSRSIYLAEAGSHVVRLGKKEAGRKLIDEAAEMVVKLGTAERQLYARGRVAVAMASYDPKRALSLVEPIEDRNERDRALSDVAVAACQEDLAKATEILGRVQGFYAERAKVRIARRLARTRSEDALKVLESIQGDFAINYRAEAYGWTAAAIAPRDKALACSLIDRGLAELLRPRERSGARSQRGRLAAFLAVQARQIGYPDMESVVSRVLAARPTTKEEFSPAAVVDSSAAMAVVLSLADAEAASEILQGIQSRSEAIGSGGMGISRDVWLEAWALADLKRGEELFDRELANLKGTAKPDRERSGLVGMAGVLATPPPERFRQVALRINFIIRGDED
jgi:hypothetical protein